MLPAPNLAVYDRADVVQDYLHHQALTKGEQRLFSEYAADFGGKHVLDIGVGAGRTTPALAGMAAAYLGIDYSAAMVGACQARFSGMPQVRFVQDDARQLAQLPDAHFDAAVFSFNGIDCLDMDGRKATLSATRRVLRPGGSFYFSFHNACYLDSLYRYHWQKNPLRWWSNYRRWQQIKSINGPKEQFAQKTFFTLKDGGEDFRLDICYVLPSFQAAMLAEHGFRLTRCFESLSGMERPLDALDHSRASWLYYRCEAV